MLQKNKELNRKKLRIKIKDKKEFRNVLKNEGFEIKDFKEEKIKELLLNEFIVNDNTLRKMKECINDEIAYRVDDIKDFIDYIEKILLFEKNHKLLVSKIKNMDEFYIDRIEYEKEVQFQEDIYNLMEIVEEIKLKTKEEISEEERERLINLEKEIEEEYLYAKDIELLKSMVIKNSCKVKESYNRDTKVKRLLIKSEESLGYGYVKVKKGTVEYHEYLNRNIPRMRRLIKNIDKYIEKDKVHIEKIRINQSKALQDSINVAVALFNGKEFKAISGSNEIFGYCEGRKEEKQAFKSMKVNKLGKLGIGYNRINDSEKKIFEEIHRQIEKKEIKGEGDLTLYSKWEPCPSCYLVINQFSKKYPLINVRVKYGEKYGSI